MTQLVVFLAGMSAFAVPAVAQDKLPAPPMAQPGDPRAPIIPDSEFEAAIPSLNAPPLESVEDWQKAQDAKDQTAQTANDPPIPAAQDGDVLETLPDAPVTDPLLDDPLPPIDSFDAEPPPNPAETADEEQCGSDNHHLDARVTQS